MAAIIRYQWGRDVVIVQKARRSFERTDDWGNPLVGIPANVTSRGDPAFGKATARMVGKEDAIVYVGGEDAWPHFVPGCKGMHVGVWWDGPYGWMKRYANKRRTMALLRAARSVLCVDTNTINWLRCQGSEGLELCNKCVYIPNCTDLSRVPGGDPDREVHKPLRLIFARRYDRKRGPDLLLDALRLVMEAGFPFEATFCMAQGQDGGGKLLEAVKSHGLQEAVSLVTKDMDTVLSMYESADVAVVPTIWSEGTSYAAVEAICAGLPVVTTPVGGLANLVVPEFNGLIVAPVAEELASAIMRFGDGELWLRMRRNCLSMRPALSLERWKRQVLDWLKT
jgi:glycosyltransferase involved in cell wall biosynthesis